MNLTNYSVIRLLSIYTVGAFLFLPGCGNSDDYELPDRPTESPLKTVAVDPAITYQTIAGFGGANRVFGGSFPTNEDMKKAFGMGDNQLGMSIFRIKVPPNESDWEGQVRVATEALKYGAKIIASPWSPPAALKSNGSTVGGYLPEENYRAFVDHLNAYLQFMTGRGVDIYAISVQNEPDIEVEYESCDWTASAMQDFITNYGHLIEGAKVAAPESFNFNPFFTNQILEDGVAENVDIVAGHIYGGGLGAFPLAEAKGKEIWMTEYLMNQGATSAWSELAEDVIWDETMDMLLTIHQAMEFNWNAYIWWYLKRYYSFLGEGDQGTEDGEILKRGYAFSHFSKYIRPGYVRVDVDAKELSDLHITAYKGEGKIVFVFINQTSRRIPNFNLIIKETVPSAATSYTTSATLNARLEELTVSEDGNVAINMSPESVTTVVMDL